MRVALYGATGRAGSRILDELVQRGHHVVAITRDAPVASADANVTWETDDLSPHSPHFNVEHMARVIRGTDAVVCAYAPPAGQTDLLVGACERLADAVLEAGVPRLLVVGGAGVLLVAPGVTLIQSGKLPPEWMPIALSHAKALAALEKSSSPWTYLSPAAMFEPGERTGRYRLSEDSLIFDIQGESRISMEDYAIAMVDELEQPKHVRSRFGVAW